MRKSLMLMCICHIPFVCVSGTFAVVQQPLNVELCNCLDTTYCDRGSESAASTQGLHLPDIDALTESFNMHPLCRVRCRMGFAAAESIRVLEERRHATKAHSNLPGPVLALNCSAVVRMLLTGFKTIAHHVLRESRDCVLVRLALLNRAQGLAAVCTKVLQRALC